jgi:pseudouridine-5'-phosphate glycosidase
MIAEQAKLKADYENEKKVAAAEADAAAKLKEAEAQKAIAAAEAEALLVKAQAEAEANRIITESITPELLEKILAENWDGKLPDTYVGDGSDLGIILPNP